MYQKLPVNDNCRMLYSRPNTYTHIVDRVLAQGKSHVVPRIMEQTELDEKAIAILFTFTACEDLMVNRELA